MKVIIIDNYDSFTYNLVHLVQSILNQKVDVIRNDKLDLDKISDYDKILLSPGPGIPDEAGQLKDVIKKYASTKSIFGVCLGLQAIAEVFGAELANMSNVFHGIASEIKLISDDKLFNKLPETFLACRYHSWIVSTERFPASLEITACDSDDDIMALSHKTYDVKGVQFHPESILTEYGEQIIRNWLFQDQEGTINLPSSGNASYDSSQLSKLIFC
jgi:anthranilate synthase component 2